MKTSLIARFSATLAVAILVSVTPLWATDFTELHRALTTYLAALDNFVNAVPEAQTPESAAKAINSLADANTKIANFIARFPKEHPEVVKLGNNPPEFAAIFATMEQAKPKIVSIALAANVMRQRFGSDPQFAVAMMALEKSTDLMRSSQPPQALQLAGGIFRELTSVDRAIDMWALQLRKKSGDLPTPADVAVYLPVGSRLRNSAEHGKIFDSLGNPITINPVGTPPYISPQSVTSLSNVVPLDFWKPFVAQPATVSL